MDENTVPVTRDRLQEQLAGCGIESAALPGTAGGSLLAIGPGARILRLTGPSGTDFLWLNPQVAAGAVANVWEKDGWRNLGGDRTWVAPEIDFFIRDKRDPFATYAVPAACDPGAYTLTVDGDAIRLRSAVTMRHNHSDAKVSLTIDKAVRVAPNPLLGRDGIADTHSVEYIGYTQKTTFALIDESPALRVGLWDLAQVPATGKIIVPVTSRAPIKRYFGPEIEGRVTQSAGAIIFPVDEACKMKIGIRADWVTGRIGYVRYESADIWSLIVRDFPVVANGLYVDVPWEDELGSDTGYIVQCYCDDSALGGFGEVEYHTPGIGLGTGRTSYSDESSLWAYRGDFAAIRGIGSELLGVALPDANHRDNNQ